MERMSPTRVGEKRRRLYCEHCKRFLSKSTYYRHRAKYFDTRKNVWVSELEVDQSSSSDSGSSIQWEDDRDVDHETTARSVTDEQGFNPALTTTSDSESSSTTSEEQTHHHISGGIIEDPEWSSGSEEDFVPQSPSVLSHLKILLIFIIIWQFSFKVSNAAITSLLHFLRYFIACIGKAFQSGSVQDIGHTIPITLATVHKLLHVDKNNFISYVVCSSCHSVYEYNDCFQLGSDGQQESKQCAHIDFPNHPQPSRRVPCGTLLLKKVRTKKGFVLSPIKVYPYKPLRKSIEQLAKRDGFIGSCEKWRARQSPEGYLCDVYDGTMWRKFNSKDGYDFLTSPHCYLLTLNVDWFEPFERGVYSVGAIYLSIQNLPRDERYRPENIMIVGILPGPKEPKKTINSYLTPLVLELKEAWYHGFNVLAAQNVPLCIKLALTCVTCDIPASRKVCGFLGHNAALGCNKCLKKFNVQFGQPTNFSGYDRDNWVLRSKDQHCKGLEEIKKEVTKTGLQKGESAYGLRYSVLLALPYFDPIQFTAIDSMHNLFLGSGKHVFDVWVESNILTKQNLAMIERKLKLFRVPADVGRLPSCISSCYGAFTASQWKNWITIYSPVLLKDILPLEHFRCWLLYVRSCCIFSLNCIMQSDLITADLLLAQFCREFQRLHGDMSCTFNMHLHLHLKQTMLDFGPPHASWCFAFERYNGILGAYHTNNRAIEPQIMKKFCHNQAIYGLDVSGFEELSSVLPHCYNNNFKNDELPNSLRLLHSAVDELSTIDSFAFTSIEGITALPPFFEDVFAAEAVEELESIYKQLYPSRCITNISCFYRKFGRITLAGDLIGSDMPGANSRSSSVIMAFWPDRGHSLANIDYSRMRVGVIQYFIEHRLHYDLNGSPKQEEHVFAYIRWKELHHHHDWYGSSATVCANMFEYPAACCLLPVQRIARRCAYIVLPVDFYELTETVFIACPIALKYSL